MFKVRPPTLRLTVYKPSPRVQAKMTALRHKHDPRAQREEIAFARHTGDLLRVQLASLPPSRRNFKRNAAAPRKNGRN